MTHLQKTIAQRRLLLGISNVGTWVLASVAGIVWLAPSGSTPITQTNLLKVALAILTLQAFFDFLGGSVLMPKACSLAVPHSQSATPLRDFPPLWFRGMWAHSLLLGAIGILSYWSFQITHGFSLSVFASSLGLFFGRRPLLTLIAGSKTQPSLWQNTACWSAHSTDPSFTGGTCGIGPTSKALIPQAWNTQLSAHQLQTVLQRRLWQIKHHLPLRAFLFTLLWNLAGCQLGSLLLGLPARPIHSAILLQACWMTLWSFFALLILPSLSRSSVFASDRAVAAAGADASGWIQKFPDITGEDGHAQTLLQRLFYPIPSAAERLRHLKETSHAPLLGNVARTNLFLSLATLTILGRCVHCNVGRPELWVFPPSD